MSTVAVMEVESTTGAESFSHEKDSMQTEDNVIGRGDLMAAIQGSLFLNNSSEIPLLEKAERLFEMGFDAVQSGQYDKGLDLLGRALRIRVAHYGQLAPECGKTYLEYGRALLFKAIKKSIPVMCGDEENDEFLDDDSEEEEDGDEPSNSSYSPLVDTETAFGTPTASTIIKSSEGAFVNDNSRDELISSAYPRAAERKDIFNMEEKKADRSEEPAIDDVSSNNEDSKDELCQGDCDSEMEDTDLYLSSAWRMLDIARRIFEKDEKANDLKIADASRALGDISRGRGDLDTCLKDYTKALTILEGTAVPDSPQIATVCHRMCSALASQDRVAEALNYGRRAAKIFECRLYRIRKEVKRIEAELRIKAYDGAPAFEQDLQNRDLYLIEMRMFGQELNEVKDKIQKLEQIIEDKEKEESVKVSTPTSKEMEQID